MLVSFPAVVYRLLAFVASRPCTCHNDLDPELRDALTIALDAGLVTRHVNPILREAYAGAEPLPQCDAAINPDYRLTEDGRSAIAWHRAYAEEARTDHPLELSGAGPGVADGLSAVIFERLRDRVCDALDLVCEIHRAALGAGPDQTLEHVAPWLHEPLHRAVTEAQAVWFDTPARRHLERSTPVYLDRLGRSQSNGPSGTCYHDLALAVAVGLLRWIETDEPAQNFVRSLRFHTAAGDDVGQYLCTIKTHVACECQQVMASISAAADRPETSAAEQGPARAGGGNDRAGSTATAAPADHAPEDELNDRQCLILEAMLANEITSQRRRASRLDIVRLVNRKHKPATYGRAFAALVKRGYLDKCEGGRGGMWLTPAGRAEAERLRSSDRPPRTVT
jgi:hypothetical protein